MAQRKHYYLKLSSLIALLGVNSLFADQPYQPPQLAEPSTLPAPNPNIVSSNVVGITPVSQLLNWVHDPDPKNICSGYYQETPIIFPTVVPNQSVALSAKSVIFKKNQPTLYLGHVLVTQPDLQASSDKAITYMDSKKQTIDEIKASGNVRVHQPGMLTVANQADIHVKTQTGTFYDLVYRLLRTSALPQSYVTPNSPTYKVPGLSARGKADVATQSKPQQYDFTNATYTSCAPGNNSWELSAKTLQIDDKTKEVIAHNAYLTVDKVPVFYSPYLDFSYDKTRKSGFLLPIVGYSDTSGFEYGQPFYWNLAPNYDTIITPTYYSNHGVLLTNDFNYLTWDTLGELYFGFIPYDSEFATFRASAFTPGNPNGYQTGPGSGQQRLENDRDYRGYLSWQHQYYIDPYWLSQTNVNYVTDDYYFTDFGTTPWNIAQNQLQQSTDLQFNGRYWTFNGMMENYQTLHPINTSNVYNDQYARWPQLDLNADYPDQWGGLEYALQDEYVNFHRAVLTDYFTFNPASNIVSGTPTQITGQRVNIQPEVSLPQYATWGYIKPDAQFEATAYSLDNIPTNAWTTTNPVGSPSQYTPNSPNTISRGIPIFDIDSGLYFDRNASLGSKSYTQTFEPRLFYLYIPNVNQENIPIFDTSESLFNYDTVFQTNRYEGIDRINNANQIGAGFTSHLINNDSGFDQLDFDTGEIFYFANRLVSLCPPNTALSTQGCTPTLNDTAPVSPIASDLNYHINNALTLSASDAYNPTYGALQNGSINLAYSADAKHIFNVGVNYQRYNALDIGILNSTPGTSTDSENIEQFTTSAYWPINYKWAMMGSLTYVLNGHYAQNYLGGVEYDTCCWAVRAVTARNFIILNNASNPTFDTEYYLQWVLKSFTSVAFNNSTSLLQTSIPGFTDNLQKY